MKCAEALGALLEADPKVLSGDGSTPLARHLRECPSCRVRAQVVLDGQARLGEALTKTLRLPDLDQVLVRAEGADETPEEAKDALRRRMGPRRITRTLIPLAAAALLVLYLGRTPSLPGPTYRSELEETGLGVEVPEGQSVAVLETRDPNIAVVWIF